MLPWWSAGRARPQNTAGRRNGSFRPHRRENKNPRNSCSIRALRAGSCPLRCHPAMCRMWRARRGGDAFREGERAGPLQPARRRRTALPGRRRSLERFARASPFPRPALRAARPAVRRYWIFSALENETRGREHVEIAFFDPVRAGCCTCERTPRVWRGYRHPPVRREARLRDTFARRGPLRIRATVAVFL